MRDTYLKRLQENEIGYKVLYPKVIYDYVPYRHLKGRCPRAEEACSQIFSIPVHPNLSDEDITRVVNIINEVNGEL